MTKLTQDEFIHIRSKAIQLFSTATALVAGIVVVLLSKDDLLESFWAGWSAPFEKGKEDIQRWLSFYLSAAKSYLFAFSAYAYWIVYRRTRTLLLRQKEELSLQDLVKDGPYDAVGGLLISLACLLIFEIFYQLPNS